MPWVAKQSIPGQLDHHHRSIIIRRTNHTHCSLLMVLIAMHLLITLVASLWTNALKAAKTTITQMETTTMLVKMRMIQMSTNITYQRELATLESWMKSQQTSSDYASPTLVVLPPCLMIELSPPPPNCSTIGGAAAFDYNARFLSLSKIFYGKKKFQNFVKLGSYQRFSYIPFTVQLHDMASLSIVICCASVSYWTACTQDYLMGQSVHPDGHYGSSNIIIETHYAQYVRAQYRTLQYICLY